MQQESEKPQTIPDNQLNVEFYSYSSAEQCRE